MHRYMLIGRMEPRDLEIIIKSDNLQTVQRYAENYSGICIIIDRIEGKKI